jgi:hypothetical protein
MSLSGIRDGQRSMNRQQGQANSANRDAKRQMKKCGDMCAKLASCYLMCGATCCPFEACDACYCLGEGEAPPPELVGKWTQGTQGGRAAEASKATFEIHANGLIEYKHYVCNHNRGGPCGSTRYRVKVKGWNHTKMSVKGGNITNKAADGPGFTADQEVEGSVLCCLKRPFRMSSVGANSRTNEFSMSVVRFVPWRWSNSESAHFDKEGCAPTAAAGNQPNPVAVAQKVDSAPVTVDSTPVTVNTVTPVVDSTPVGAPMDIEMAR